MLTVNSQGIYTYTSKDRGSSISSNDLNLLKTIVFEIWDEVIYAN